MLAYEKEMTDNLDWNYELLLELIGPPLEAVAMFERHQLPAPSADAVGMWRLRKRIQGPWVAAIVHMLLSEGKIADIHDVILPPVPA
jgi:hypothetical protein